MLQPSPVLPPTTSPQPVLPTSPPSLETWAVLAPGLERRVYVPQGNSLSQIIALRIDPAQYMFRVHYRLGEPLTVGGWQDELPGAAALINTNFFDPDQRIVGLLVADGVTYGQPYTDRGGMFVIQDGVPGIRSNTSEPYVGEPLEQAVQAFPMLVQNGQQVYTLTNGDRVTRRTAIGIDTQGRVILMATPLTGLMLADLSAFLAESDLDLVNAFNLDGGGSTMMAAKSTTGISDVMLFSRDPVPAVLAAYPR